MMAKEERENQEQQQVEESKGASVAQDFIERNKNLVQYVGGTLAAIIVLGFFGYNYFTGQNQEAQEEMFRAVFYFEKDSLDLALYGDGDITLGFEDIVDDYGYTEAGNLAKYYAGACHLKMGNFEEAVDFLKDFSGDDLFVQARAYCLIGDAYMEMDEFGDAIDYYKRASDYKPNKSFTPMYLMKLGLAYETVNNWEAAAEAYGRIISEFPGSTELNDAKKFKARAEIEKTNT